MRARRRRWQIRVRAGDMRSEMGTPEFRIESACHSYDKKAARFAEADKKAADQRSHAAPSSRGRSEASDGDDHEGEGDDGGSDSGDSSDNSDYHSSDRDGDDGDDGDGRGQR